MRVMVKFRFPVETGNDVVRTGKVAQVFQGLMEELKPEAAYFFPEGGERAGLFVVDMQQSPQVASTCERFWFGLNASIELVPVMNADDLQTALAGIESIVQRYG